MSVVQSQTSKTFDTPTDWKHRTLATCICVSSKHYVKVIAIWHNSLFISFFFVRVWLISWIGVVSIAIPTLSVASLSTVRRISFGFYCILYITQNKHADKWCRLCIKVSQNLHAVEFCKHKWIMFAPIEYNMCAKVQRSDKCWPGVRIGEFWIISRVNEVLTNFCSRKIDETMFIELFHFKRMSKYAN